jgi:hypothetical protein
MNVVNFTRTAATEDVFGPLDDRLVFDVLSSDVVPYGMQSDRRCRLCQC